MALDLGTLAAKLAIDDAEFQAKLKAANGEQVKVTVDTSDLKYIPPEVATAGAAAGDKFGTTFKGQAAPKVDSAITQASSSAAEAGTAAGSKYGTAFKVEAKSRMAGVNDTASTKSSGGGTASNATTTFAGIAAAIAAVGALAQQVGAAIQSRLDAGMAKSSQYADMLLTAQKNAGHLTDDQAQGWRMIAGMTRDMQDNGLVGMVTGGKSLGTALWDAAAALVGMKGETATVTDQFTQLDDAVQELGTAKVGSALGEITQQMVSMRLPAQKILDLLPKTSAALQDQAHQLGVGSLSAEDYVSWMGGKVPAAVQAAANAQPELAKQLGITTTATQVSTTATEKSTDATKKATSAVQKYLDKISAMASKLLGLRGDHRAFEAAVDAATDSVKKNGRTLSDHTEKGRANQEALDGIASAAISLAQSMHDAGKPTKAINAEMGKARTAFIRAAVAMGMSKDAAVALANKLGLIKSKEVKVTTTYTTRGQQPPNTTTAADRWQKHAAGGMFGPGWSLVGEQGPELVRFNGSGRVYTANETKQMLNGPSAGGSGRQVTIQQTINYPRSEPTSVSTNRALELVTILGG